MNGIWVRTQDKKRLVNCKDIEAVGGTVISNYDKEDYFKLGVYQTNERALEVLDEIQEHIETRTVANEMLKSLFNSETVMSNDEVLKRAKKLSCVYEMPKE